MTASKDNQKSHMDEDIVIKESFGKKINRREIIKKLGKAAYAAPTLTIISNSVKAEQLPGGSSPGDPNSNGFR